MTKNTIDKRLGSQLVDRIAKMEQGLREIRTKQLSGSDVLSNQQNFVSATSNVVLSTSWQDITGATVTFDPAIGVTARIIIITVFEFQGAGAGSSGTCQGRLNVDTVGQTDMAIADVSGTIIATPAMAYSITLTSGASHTLKLEASLVSGGTPAGDCVAAGTSFLYWYYRN